MNGLVDRREQESNPDGHPFKNEPLSTLLNFGILMGTSRETPSRQTKIKCKCKNSENKNKSVFKYLHRLLVGKYCTRTVGPNRNEQQFLLGTELK